MLSRIATTAATYTQLVCAHCVPGYTGRFSMAAQSPTTAVARQKLWLRLLARESFRRPRANAALLSPTRAAIANGATARALLMYIHTNRSLVLLVFPNTQYFLNAIFSTYHLG